MRASQRRQCWGAKMKTRNLLGGTALALALVLSGQAFAAGNNNPPPAGPVVLDLAGTAVPHAYTQYTTSFVAGAASTHPFFPLPGEPGVLFLFDLIMNPGGGAHPGTPPGSARGPPRPTTPPP